MVQESGDQSALASVRSVIDLGHHLNLRVVAEGVETREPWDLLRSLGCDAAQGCYFSRPVLAVEFVSLFVDETAGRLVWAAGGDPP